MIGWGWLPLAEQVIGPVLDAERAAIALWRFHRRVARDGAGCQFSFIFRASPATAVFGYREPATTRRELMRF